MKKTVLKIMSVVCMISMVITFNVNADSDSDAELTKIYSEFKETGNEKLPDKAFFREQDKV